MSDSPDPGALMARHYTLDNGTRVRLRLVRTSDVDGVRDLLSLGGGQPTELGLARLLNFDMRRRIVICATALVGSSERVLGIGLVELGATGAEPSMLFTDELQAPGLTALLRESLVEQASAISRARAA